MVARTHNLVLVEQALNDHRAKSFVYAQVFIALVTIISITTIIMETVESLGKFHTLFAVIEWFTAIVFSLEYLGRLATTEKKIGYIFSFWGLIDFISIAPTFLALGNLTALKSARVLRIMRLMRIFRLAKVSRAYLQTHEDIKAKGELARINMVIYFLALFSSVIAFGSALYVVENHQQAYANIPLAMIQSAKILLGGLGQAAATTMPGELTILLARLAGLALFGLLISVIGSGLNQLLFGGDKDGK